jgi:hypothetical protein
MGAGRAPDGRGGARRAGDLRMRRVQHGRWRGVGTGGGSRPHHRAGGARRGARRAGAATRASQADFYQAIRRQRSDRTEPPGPARRVPSGRERAAGYQRRAGGARGVPGRLVRAYDGWVRLQRSRRHRLRRGASPGSALGTTRQASQASLRVRVHPARQDAHVPPPAQRRAGGPLRAPGGASEAASGGERRRTGRRRLSHGGRSCVRRGDEGRRAQRASAPTHPRWAARIQGRKGHPHAMAHEGLLREPGSHFRRGATTLLAHSAERLRASARHHVGERQ